MHEENLLMKVEAVTDNAPNTKRQTMVVCLCELCDDVDNAKVVFSAFRARLSDGLRYSRHLSMIKCLWLIELLIHHGPLIVLDFLPAVEPHLSQACQFYDYNSNAEVDSAFSPVFEKSCELYDLVKAGSYKVNKTKMFSTEDAVKRCLVDMEVTIKKVIQTLKSKISNEEGGRNQYELSEEKVKSREESLSLVKYAMSGTDDAVDSSILDDLVLNIKASSKAEADVVAVLTALKKHLTMDTMSVEKAVHCRKVFEILNFFVDHGIDTDSVFNKEDLERYARFDYQAGSYDYGLDVRKEASKLLGFPTIGSFEEGGVDVSEVSISFGSLSRFDSDENDELSGL